METPIDLKYAKTHEWVRTEEDTITVGITDYAQDQLGDVVYVELPEIGREVSIGEAIVVVESVKTASDIYSPATGVVVAVNEALGDSPEQVNENPYENGWLFKVRFTDLSDELVDAQEYEQYME
ncbi:glycine cleavage system protein GcvH [Deinococcus cellulosilyticus]|uniref:Glycine cleavage system H protein n=1 Tax=Deinococcus cellulosilyticus (strain DSM 18568 / NBRC 106333 / KACC 11606 / 5516J-15) TaxID=1223518 RepID=A0A511NAV3_DEIC1|nr:glycine cleavage system protein GcvH [Deinococcus cellulosilyticus]GEM49676.1 glycine cleavage system H protein [Deinococcus cellulosilyticus NBRC 106333 = KACC 11606]